MPEATGRIFCISKFHWNPIRISLLQFPPDISHLQSHHAASILLGVAVDCKFKRVVRAPYHSSMDVPPTFN